MLVLGITTAGLLLPSYHVFESWDFLHAVYGFMYDEVLYIFLFIFHESNKLKLQSSFIILSLIERTLTDFGVMNRF